MTFKDSIHELLDNLVKSTLNGNVTWTEPITGSPNRLEVIIDKITFSFSISWKLELDSGWTMSKGWIQIKDESSDFDFTVYSFNFPELISKLQDHLCELHFNKFRPSNQDVIQKVDNISRKISVEEHRDNKIKKILN